MEQLERKVTVIKPTIDLSVCSQKERKLRVCAYARVSTDMDEQKNSFEFQLKEYETQIKKNPNWILTRLYSDEGISGTSLKNRDGIKEMIEDAKVHKVDLILTKSISRFARNVVDFVSVVRELRNIGVDVYFEKENIHGLSQESDMVLSIFASIAQEESRSISENCKWGIRKRMQRNEYNPGVSNMLGLKKDSMNKIVIDKETALTVKQIYNLFLSGFTLREIASFLMESDVKTPRGNEDWNISTIRSILTNEKYCGDVTYQKTFIKDYISHKAVKNNGELPKYHISNNHEALISKDVFMKVQELLKEKSNFSRAKKPKNIFFNLGYCECCNRPMIMITTHPNTSFSNFILTCKVNKLENCQSKPFDYSLYLNAMDQLIKSILSIDNDYIKSIILNSVSDSELYDYKIDQLEKDNIKLQEKLDVLIESQIKAGNTSDLDFYEKTFTTIKMKISANKKEIDSLKCQMASSIKDELLINKIKEFIDSAIAIDYDIVHYFISKVIFKENRELNIYLKDSNIYKLFKENKITFESEKGSITYNLKEEFDVPSSSSN